MIKYSLLKNVSIIGKTNYNYPEKDDLNTCSVVFKYFFLKSERAAGLTIIRKGIDNWAVEKKCLKCSFKASIHSLFRGWLSGLKSNRLLMHLQPRHGEHK